MESCRGNNPVTVKANNIAEPCSTLLQPKVQKSGIHSSQMNGASLMKSGDAMPRAHVCGGGPGKGSMAGRSSWYVGLALFFVATCSTRVLGVVNITNWPPGGLQNYVFRYFRAPENAWGVWESQCDVQCRVCISSWAPFVFYKNGKHSG